MTLKLLKADAAAKKRLKKMYLEAFPAEERAPFWRLWRRAAQGHAEFWCLADGREPVGMAYIIRDQRLAYLFYLAIDRSMRGRGYGTAALDALRGKYAGSRLFLALEAPDLSAPNCAERVRRHEFYRRCGLEDLPHRIKEMSVVFNVMGIGGPVQPEEYRSLLDRWLGWPARLMIDMRMLPDDDADQAKEAHS